MDAIFCCLQPHRNHIPIIFQAFYSVEIYFSQFFVYYLYGSQVATFCFSFFCSTSLKIVAFISLCTQHIEKNQLVAYFWCMCCMTFIYLFSLAPRRPFYSQSQKQKHGKALEYHILYMASRNSLLTFK